MLSESLEGIQAYIRGPPLQNLVFERKFKAKHDMYKGVEEGGGVCFK